MPSDSYGMSDLDLVIGGTTCRQRYWVHTPGYHSMPKSQLPMNYYNVSKHTVSQIPWTFSRKSGSSSWIVYNNIYPYYLRDIVTTHNNEVTAMFPPAAWEALLDEAMYRALARAADQKVNLAVALAEAKKTSDMILSAANRIDKAYRALRRGNFAEVARQLNISPKRVHKTWLEYKYGWMPVLMDVKGGAEAYAQSTLPRTLSFSVVGTAKASASRVREVGDDHYGTIWPHTLTTSGEYKAKVKIFLKLTSSRAAGAASLGLTNPALFAWELVPYSFVFDWLISVGDWLAAQSSLDGLTVVKAFESMVEQTKHSAERPAITIKYYGDPNELFIYSARSSKDSRNQYLRNPVSPDPSSLGIRTAFGPLGFQKTVTALALMRARSSR